MGKIITGLKIVRPGTAESRHKANTENKKPVEMHCPWCLKRIELKLECKTQGTGKEMRYVIKDTKQVCSFCNKELLSPSKAKMFMETLFAEGSGAATEARKRNEQQ